jgi:Domain of unknown function (DUF5615)
VTVRFLVDEDVNAAIIHGLRAREPAIDILDMKTAGLRGSSDPVLLELAAREDRVLVTSDRNSMTSHFHKRLNAGLPTTGVFVLSQQESIGAAIEFLLLVWSASELEEWRNQIVYLPNP